MHPPRGSFPEGRIKEDPGPHDARGSVAEWGECTGYGTPPGTSRRRGAVRFLPLGRAGRSESKYCRPGPGTGPPPLVVIAYVQHEPR